MKMNRESIAKQLEYDESNSSFEFDDEIQDPDYHSFENNDLGGILAIDSDPENNFELRSTSPSGSINIIPESSEDELTPSTSIGIATPSGSIIINIIPESSEEEQPTSSTSTRIGKKRKINKSNWQRNITKKCRSEGVEHISLRNKIIVPPRTTGPDCHCNQKCFTNVSDDQKMNLLAIFNNIGDKNKQDTYLAGLVRVNPVIRQRKRDGSRSSKTCSVKYEIKSGLDIIPVCKKTFCSLFGVGKSRVERIIKSVQNHVPSPEDKRGKHHSRPNKIPDNINFQLDTFINSFPKRKSHYSRSDNNNVKYMSPELSISKLYRMYLQKYEPNVWADLNSENCEQVKPKLKYNYFANYFNTNFNISFAYPRSDTCQTCDNLKKIIDNENNAEEKANLKVEKQIHLRKAEVFYTYLRELTAQAKQNDSTVEVLSFDY
ncbi:hypothetical protein ACI65C_013705 [Semiaphis heraclei]